MSEDRLDYGEVLCEAVDTIISKKLENLAYDITKTCIVIDDTYKKQGRYTVADGALKFEAYSTITTLNINDNVLVNIPHGDYSNQKTILNKIINNDKALSLNYISPLNNMLKFTDNILTNITPVEIMREQGFGILANDEEITNKLIYSINWDEFSGFTRMGLSVDFQTRLNQYKIISGSYGIKLLFEHRNGTQAREFDLGIIDMNGNPYQFDIFSTQMKLFDISQVENIQTVKIYLYQNNDFFDETNTKIPSEVEGDIILGTKSEKMNDNILIKDLQLYLGYSLSEFNGEFVQISTSGYATYNQEDNKNKSYLDLRWVHKVDDNTYITFTNDDVAIRDIKIYWMRYTLNANTSEDRDLGGPNWSRDNIDQKIDIDCFKSSFEPDWDKPQTRVKAVCTFKDDDGELRKFESNILIFENEKATIDMLTFNAATKLSIECSDGSEGNYFIYNQSGKIINEGQGQGFQRKFEAKFRGLPLDHVDTGLSNITEIRWTLPLDGNNRYTMLSYSDKYFEKQPADNDYKSGYVEIVRTKKSNEAFDTTQSYSIKNNWHSSNASNLVKCQIIADGTTYEASLDLQFGKAGSSGTNITLVLEFENNQNAMLNEDNSSIKVKAIMYDMAGNRISTPSTRWTWEWLYEENLIQLEKNNTSSQITLTLPKKIDTINLEKNYHILKATHQSDIPISAYLTIPIKDSNFGYIEGAKEVIYNSQGIPDYYTDAYVLFDATQKELKADEWILSQDINVSLKLQDLDKNGITYKALSANPFYIKDQENKACVSAKIGDKIAWSQPILIMQSQYDYATLNNWNGNVEIGAKTIMSTMLGVGKKNEDNEFSGIIIGDIEALAQEAAEDDGVDQTTGVGLYGLTEGIISFSLTDKGIATFGGANNNGLVMLGGEGNTVTSANGNYLIDIDKGINAITYNNSYEKLSLGDGNYLTLLDKNNNKILQFEKDNYLLKSSFGNLEINLNNGKIISKGLTINNSDSSALKCGNLDIDWSGNITTPKITIGSLILSSESNAISIGNFTVSSTGEVKYKNVELEQYIKNLIQANQTPTT